MLRRFRCARGLMFWAPLAVGLVASPLAAQPQLHPRGLNPVVEAAALEAYRRLGDPACQEIFSEFRDATNRELRDRLDEIGQTGQSYLGWIWFVDDGTNGLCDRSEIMAFTTPGSQVVYFCGDRFTRSVTRRGLGFLASVVIHEELHSLGLTENPPSSEEITRRVEARCGP